MTTAGEIAPDNLEASTATDPFRLRFCPQCDYDLQSLPLAGRCPECGREYDQSFIILRGRPARREQALQAGGLSPKTIAITVLPWLLFIPVVFHGPNGYAAVVIAIVAVTFGLSLLTWMNSPRPGEVLVWICDKGIGQQNDFDPTSLTAKLRRLAPTTGLFIYFVVLFNGQSLRHTLSWVAALTIYLGLTRFAARRTRRRSLASFAVGVQPDIFDWKRMRPTFTRTGDECRLKVLRKSKVHETYPVDIFFKGDYEFVLHLETQIKIWKRECDQKQPA